MSNVIKINSNTPDPVAREVVHPDLLELAYNPELSHYQIVCHWKGNKSASGWSQGIPLSTMALGTLVMQSAIDKLINAVK